MRVLVTDGATNKGLAAVRSVAGVADAVGVSSRFPVSPAGISRHADASHWIRDRSPGGYVRALNDIAAEMDYDHVLPVGGRTFEVVSDHRDDLVVPVDRMLPRREAMQVALEKARTYEVADEQDVPVPRTVTVSDPSAAGAAGETVGYPAVVKTGVETEDRFVRRVGSADELAAAVRDYAADHDSAPLVQEYLPGDGRGYFGLYREGELVDGYAHRRIREYPPEGGASACAVSERDAELREYATRLMEALSWTGVSMVEFKEAADGTPAVVEINPKFWGSLDLGIASGLDFPRALLEFAEATDPAEVAVEFEFTPSRYHWPLSGDLTHAWRRPETATAVLRDLLSPRTQSNLALDDALPHVLEGLITLVRWDA